MQRYVSDELTHLTGRAQPDENAYEALLSILGSGELRHSGEALPHGTFGSNSLHGAVLTSPDADLVGHEMFKADVVCFCDIPVADLAIHAKKYSRFGLAFRKHFLLEKGATPVFYVASDATTPSGRHVDDPLSQIFEEEVERLHHFFRMVRDLHSPAPGEQREGLTEEQADQDLFMLSMRVWSFLVTRVFGFLKFFEAGLPPDHESHYYMEREWRVLGGVSFLLDDVYRVLVPPEYGARLRADLPDYFGQVSFLSA